MVATPVPASRRSREQRAHFAVGFAQSHHEAGFGEHVGGVAAGEAQHVERLPVIGLRAHPAVEARHGFHVVIEDVRAGIEHAGDGVEVSPQKSGVSTSTRASGRARRTSRTVSAK